MFKVSVRAKATLSMSKGNRESHDYEAQGWRQNFLAGRCYGKALGVDGRIYTVHLGIQGNRGVLMAKKRYVAPVKV